MKRLMIVCLAILTGASVPTNPAWATESIAGRVDRAIDSAVSANEQRVVQLRYFGAGKNTIGAAAAPVTGFVIGNGWVLTSDYALGTNPAGILCRFADGSQEQARLIARDHGRRVALLSLRAEKEQPAPAVLGREARVGETAIALGRVYSPETVQLSVGVVSAIGRFGGRALQTDALASPTNYGGPLIGLDGVLLGLVTPLAASGQEGVALYDSGVGFAVSPSQLRRSLATLASGQDLQPGWLGASFENKNPLASSPTLKGVTPNGPAAASGLRAGDKIISLAGRPTPFVWQFKAVLSGLDAGQTADATFLRGETLRDIKITFGKKPKASPQPKGKGPLGVTVPTKKPGEP